jgi:hypothetical protein
MIVYEFTHITTVYEADGTVTFTSVLPQIGQRAKKSGRRKRSTIRRDSSVKALPSELFT